MNKYICQHPLSCKTSCVLDIGHDVFETVLMCPVSRKFTATFIKLMPRSKLKSGAVHRPTAKGMPRRKAAAASV